MKDDNFLFPLEAGNLNRIVSHAAVSRITH